MNNDNNNDLENDEITENEVNSEEYEITRQSLNKKVKIIAGILLLSILAVIVISVWNAIAPDKVSDTVYNNINNTDDIGFPTSIVGTNIDNNNFKIWNSNIAYVSDTSLVSVNRNGSKAVERQISYASPVMVTNGIYSLTYNLGGEGYMIDTAEDTIYKSGGKETVAEEKEIIMDADINSSGVYAILSQSSDYLSKLTIYNPDNTQKYAYYFSQHYGTAVSINESGTLAAVSGVSSKDGTLDSVVYIIDFNSETPKDIIEIGENLPLDLAYLNNGNIVFVGDTETVIMKSSDDKQAYNYEELSLTAYDIDKEQGVVLSLSRTGDGRNCNIVYIHSDKSINEEIESDYKITDVSIYGKKLSALSNGEIYVYDKNNNFVSEVYAGVDSKAICMINETTANILGVSEIRNVKW